MENLFRVRFKSDADDPRPLNWPIKHPYWITGEAGDGSYVWIVSYADGDPEKYILANWPEAYIESITPVDDYVFTDRFPKPEWWEKEHE